MQPICRDLWALYVSQKTDLTPQPYMERGTAEQDPETENQSMNAKRAASSRRAALAERQSILEEEWEESEAIRKRLMEVGVVETKEDAPSQSDGAETWRATSSEWESALDQDSNENDDNLHLLAPKKRQRKGRRKNQKERQEGNLLQRQSRDDLDNILSILHLALITMRVPITWSDLCTSVSFVAIFIPFHFIAADAVSLLLRLIRAGKMPYLNIVHQLPTEMVQPFPSREVRKLDPSVRLSASTVHFRHIDTCLSFQRVPSVQSLHRRTVALAMDLYDSCGLEFPELNSLPILWRCVERMLLPRKPTDIDEKGKKRYLLTSSHLCSNILQGCKDSYRVH